MPARRKTAARRDETRARIIDAATEQIRENGFRGAQMSLVAFRAGVGVGSLYTHFESQAELFAAVYEQSVTHELEVLRGVSADSALDQLALAIRTFCARSLQAGQLAYALLFEPAAAVVGEHRLTQREAFRVLFAELITAAIASGELPEQDVDSASAGVLGLITETLIRPLANRDPGPHDALTERIVELSVRALGPGLPGARG